MLWFKAQVTAKDNITIGQVLCDECLDAGVASMAAARALRCRLKERCTLLALSRL